MEWGMFFPPNMPVLALPNWESPRLYVQAKNLTERWKGTAFYPAFRTRAHFYKVALRLRAMIGSKSIRMARSAQWDIGEYIKKSFPDATSLAVLVGTPGPAQKMTLRICDVEQHVLGYVKYAEKPAAQRRLQKEHRVLRDLPEGRGPQVLQYGVCGRGMALSITPVIGKAHPVTVFPSRSVQRFLGSIEGVSTTPFERHPWIQSQREQYGTMLDGVIEPLAHRDWAVVIHHGDFAPWNIIKTPHGEVRAIDWEYGCTRGFPFLDLGFYILQVAQYVSRWTPSKARSYATRFLQQMASLSIHEASALVRLSAFSTYQNALNDGHQHDDSHQIWWRIVWEETD